MFAVVVLLAVFATGQHEIEIHWSAPRGCPDGAQVNRRIAGYLGTSADIPSHSAQALADVVVTTKDGRFRAQIHTRFANVPGERTLDGDNCEAVASATALILAMMIDPEAVRGVISAPAAPKRVATPEPAPPVAPLSIVTSSENADEGFGVLILPSVLLGFGLLPETAVGGSLTLAMSQGIWEAGVVASVWGDRKARLELDQQAGGWFSRLALGPRLWRALVGKAFSARVGIGIELTRIAAQGFGVSDPSSDSSWGASPLVAIGGQMRLNSHLSLRVDAESAFPLGRPRFTLVDRGEVWRPAAASVTVGCGIQLQF